MFLLWIKLRNNFSYNCDRLALTRFQMYDPEIRLGSFVPTSEDVAKTQGLVEQTGCERIGSPIVRKSVYAARLLRSGKCGVLFVLLSVRKIRVREDWHELRLDWLQIRSFLHFSVWNYLITFTAFGRRPSPDRLTEVLQSLSQRNVKK